MNIVAAILLLFSVALFVSAEPVVAIDFFNYRLAPETRVEITVDSKGILTFKSDANIMNSVPRQVQLSSKKFQDLKQELGKVDWKIVSADKAAEAGRDGKSIRISYGKQSASLWSPDHDTTKRGLSGIQKVIEILLDSCGLDEIGLPMRNKEAESGPRE